MRVYALLRCHWHAEHRMMLRAAQVCNLPVADVPRVVGLANLQGTVAVYVKAAAHTHFTVIILKGCKN
jgi:hypothetical protein